MYNTFFDYIRAMNLLRCTSKDVRKFNKTSRKLGSSVMLSISGEQKLEAPP